MKETNHKWLLDIEDLSNNPEKYENLLKLASENKQVTDMVGELVSVFDAVRGINQNEMPETTLHRGFTCALLIAALHMGVE